MTYAWVALLGGAGAALRYLAGLAVTARLGETWPWGTFVVNVTGCFAAGLLADGVVRAGLLGGYTTFSAYAVEVVRTDVRSRAGAAAYGLGSVVAGVLAAGLGVSLRG